MSVDVSLLERRVLVLAPTGRDAVLTQSVLERGGMSCRTCRDLADACQELDAGAAVLLLAEEAVFEETEACLTRWLAGQEPWSDLPILIEVYRERRNKRRQARARAELDAEAAASAASTRTDVTRSEAEA